MFIKYQYVIKMLRRSELLYFVLVEFVDFWCLGVAPSPCPHTFQGIGPRREGVSVIQSFNSHLLCVLKSSQRPNYFSNVVVFDCFLGSSPTFTTLLKQDILFQVVNSDLQTNFLKLDCRLQITLLKRLGRRDFGGQPKEKD